MKMHDNESGRKVFDIWPKVCIDHSTNKKAISMDEALQKISFGKFNYFLILISGVILNAGQLETLGISFVLPVSTCDLNLTIQQKGVLSGIAFLGIICSSHCWGYLADTKGRRRVIQPTLFTAFCLSVCSSFTNNFYIFATLRFLNGFFMCGASATMYAYLGEFHDEKHRGRAIMGSAIIFGVLGLLLPLVAWVVINQDWMFYVPLLDIVYKPWRFYLVVCGLPGLFVSIALTVLPESPKYVLGQGDQAGALKILEKVNRWNNGSNATLDVCEIIEETESIENRRRIFENENSRFPLLKSICDQTAPLFRQPHLCPTLLICTVQFLIYATSNGLFMWFPHIINRMAAQDLNGERITMCRIINLPSNQSVSSKDGEEECVTKLELDTIEQGIIAEALCALIFIVIGLLINRIGKFLILVTLLTISGVSGVLCVFTDIPQLSTSLFIALLLCGNAVNVVNAATVEIFPTNFRAMAVCIALMCGRLGAVAGANIFAVLIDNYCDLAFLVAALSQFVAGILIFFIPKIHQKPSKSDVRDEPRLSTMSRIN